MIELRPRRSARGHAEEAYAAAPGAHPDAPTTNAGHLIHDSQYTDTEYDERLGWGHSTIRQSIAFAGTTEARHLVAFHHDPAHDDATLDRLSDAATTEERPLFEMTVAREGATFDVG